MLIGAVDFKRETLVESRRRVGVDLADRPEPSPPADPPNEWLAPFSRHAVPMPARKRLVVLLEDGPRTGAITREVFTRRLAELAQDAAKVGLLVTDEAVVDTTRDVPRAA